MKILQICHKPPFPQIDGGTIAMNNISQGLMQLGHVVKVLAIETPKHPISNSIEFDAYKKETQFESHFIDTSISIWGALKALLLRKSYHISRFDSKSLHAKIASILQEDKFDIIQLETIFVAPYINTIRQFSDAKIVIRLHNVEHKIWERLVQNENNPLKKKVLSLMTSFLKKYEISVFQHVDAFMSISDVDTVFFKSLNINTPGVTIPFGIDLSKYPMNEEIGLSKIPTFFHLGSMNWLPNIEGIEWFLDKVWPSVVKQYPLLNFKLAGRNIPDYFLKKRFPNVEIIGEVENASQFMMQNDIMIVPLLSGSGVRVKIIEGMALGKTIITTSIGAEGLEVVDDKHILIANTIEEFIYKISLCVKSPEFCKIIGHNARDFVSINHNNVLISNEIITLFLSLFNSKL